jgi:8-oxo-dGTP pyrophosphatase MutT (NUDIX family)
MSLKEKLKLRLARNLPGEKSHQEMAPKGRESRVYEALRNKELYRESAVIAPLIERDGELNLLFIERTKYEGVHSGQIGFPGGKFEKSDANLLYTAIRETQEEIGFSDFEILGPITPLYIPPSRFLVYPFLGYTAKHPALVLNHTEIARVHFIPVADLQNPVNKQVGNFHSAQGLIQAPYYALGGTRIWGATAMMIAEILALIGETVYD